jgi:hypothetical protein
MLAESTKISLAQLDITYPSYGGMDYVIAKNISVIGEK